MRAARPTASACGVAAGTRVDAAGSGLLCQPRRECSSRVRASSRCCSPGGRPAAAAEYAAGTPRSAPLTWHAATPACSSRTVAGSKQGTHPASLYGAKRCRCSRRAAAMRTEQCTHAQRCQPGNCVPIRPQTLGGRECASSQLPLPADAGLAGAPCCCTPRAHDAGGRALSAGRQDGEGRHLRDALRLHRQQPVAQRCAR